MKQALLYIFVIFTLILSGCVASDEHPQSPVESSPRDWPISTPEKHGLDSERLEELVNLIREGTVYPRLHSLLIVRHGRLVLEEYFGGFQADKLHTTQSVSKSFVSALIGIALEKGDLESLDKKILDYFPELEGIQNMDERKASIRLKDLLTMRSGTDYFAGTPESPHTQLNRLSKGWDKFYLDRPMLREPGTYFLYDSGGVILMSSILKKRTGMHADEYAENNLFKQLEIDDVFWIKNEEGHPHTGGGLNLRPRDIARFGLLYLQKGKWEDKQVVPADWVEESFKLHVEFSKKNKKRVGYGYLWWLLEPDPNGNGEQYIYAAIGIKAQYIFVIPEHDMVVVVNGDTIPRGVDQQKPVEFLYSNILPAVKR